MISSLFSEKQLKQALYFLKENAGSLFSEEQKQENRFKLFVI
jgi:hypothetical protein